MLTCPYHGMDDWLILTTFYRGLASTSHDHLDAAAKEAFFSLITAHGKELNEKIISNQGWDEDHSQPCQKDEHANKEMDMLNAKLDLIMKRVDEYSEKKMEMYNMVQAIECMKHEANHNMEDDHSRAYEDMSCNANRSYPQGGQGWKQCPYQHGGTYIKEEKLSNTTKK
ncbi:hypothetical protein QOZ80_7AG0570400 [Eleusine coracana subsp. coracana]|nr:hypothetical protein QOZ80_7AG0570400 [Eleusine coracana subsp. coracana]